MRRGSAGMARAQHEASLPVAAGQARLTPRGCQQEIHE
jgi:hypothetical protein